MYKGPKEMTGHIVPSDVSVDPEQVNISIAAGMKSQQAVAMAKRFTDVRDACEAEYPLGRGLRD